ncbi:MAG TPA: hypothetical protein VJS37_08980, partial [Terriglobales bacterium]|nr:hypothetical protein [Terriglobales bacterium]
MKRHRVLVAGLLSSFAAAGLAMLMSAYAAPVIPPLAFGVTVVLASGIPFLIVVFLAIRERRVRRISWSEML